MFKGGMAGMMQKAKQMQEDMEIAQEEIKLLTCEGISASGSIKIVLNGEYKVTNLNIDDSLLSDKEMLEDLIIIAVNDASSKVNSASKDKMKNVTDLIFHGIILSCVLLKPRQIFMLLSKAASILESTLFLVVIFHQLMELVQLN